MALLTYKHKTHVINNDGSVLSNADVDFYIDDVSMAVFGRACGVACGRCGLWCLRGEWRCLQDMVHIADTKVTKRFGDYFIRHIQKVWPV